MNTKFKNNTKRIARILLAVWVLNLLEPLSAYALTSGPSQPESQSFQPVGVSDMVDVFSGDFKYNIPLMDVDGYPVNLNYQSGVSMDDEASWVGLGWNLNVGSINRQLRGIPDDFNGNDKLITEQKTRDRITIGGRLTAKGELIGKYSNRLGSDIKDVRGIKLKPSGSFTFGIFSDNYTGIGAEIGANVGISSSFGGGGMLTSSMGIGVLSNTASGVDVTPNISTSILANRTDKVVVNAGLTSSLGYNSRAGVKTMSLGASIKSYSMSTPLVSYNTEPVLPRIQVPYFSDNKSFSLDAGVTAGIYFVGGGATGYVNKGRIASNYIVNPEYGFLYSEKGKNDNNAIHDFIREKENPVINELPNLALPIATPDIFTFNSQVGSGQFRLYRGGSGVFYDNVASNQSENLSVGADFGWGLGYHGGVTKFDQSTTVTTQKWTKENYYLKYGDFQDQSVSSPNHQHVFFRKPDEKNIEDIDLNGENGKIHGVKPLMINTAGRTASSEFKTSSYFGSNIFSIANRIEKEKRQEQSTAISYLTAGEASLAGLDKQISIYPFNDFGSFYPGSTSYHASNSRVDAVKKAHHISEITVLNEQGQRSIYGLPVYNKTQQEITFAVDNSVSHTNGRVPMNSLASGNFDTNTGIDDTDNYFHRDTQPAYASSYLLTGILSPDYLDKTGNGITDDDNGTAIKFNYSKIDPLYKWRTPYNLGSTPEAALNRGLLADPKDDKGSIVYGEKEIYYVHSIESKTKIAYFITKDRDDALGVQDINGARDLTVKQKCLMEIRLYSKANPSKPIKVVKFDYGYDLCPGSPNSVASGAGKLTLKKVWFEYGSTHKGSNHPYVFHYDSNVGYGAQMVDRWGVYKNPDDNYGSLNNEQYPYSDQNKQRADQAAALWHLNAIELPSGGKIKVTYEADDYAYVQDKKAAVMVPFDFSPGKNITNANSIVLGVDSVPPNGQDPTTWFKKVYLNGSDYIYTKSTIKLSTSNASSDGNDNDFVSAYAKVVAVSIANNQATVQLESITESGVTTNPIRFAAWQKMKNEYPRYAYPGYKNKAGANDTGMGAIIKAVGSATRNLNELWENFYQRANRKGFCQDFDAAQSFARISKASVSKIGGGARVKQIEIEDDWDTFTGSTAPKGTYGQRYEYTTQGDNGRIISSGVATYEPAIGNDENALKQPIPYIQNIKGAINNYFELEKPFGESLYPSPSVGYSRVVVKDLEGTGSQPIIPSTGYIVHEFFTAKDFPVRVTDMPMKKYNTKPESSYSFTKTNSIEEMVLSQGYSIELNDMHGKPKADRIYNASDTEISSSVYQYQVESDDATKLNNVVKVVNSKGEVNDAIVGRDIEFFTDFREQESINTGRTINVGADIVPLVFFAYFPIPHWPINDNNEYKLFRSACAVKVIQTNGILSKVIKTENGSSIAVENIAYDGVTGNALVTKTQNEFNKSYYTVNLPAYWPYQKMGGAYQNIGMLLQNVTLNGSFEINSNYWNLLTQGDELVNLGTGLHYWVVDNADVPVYVNGERQWSEPTKILVDVKGARLSSITGGSLNHTFKVVRSGFRNILDASAQSVVCVNNPIESGKLLIASPSNLSALKVINASSTIYSDEWPVDGTGQVTDRIENTSAVFTYRLAQAHTVHGSAGSRIFHSCDESLLEEDQGNWSTCDTYEPFNNNYLNTRQKQIGIWPNIDPPGINEPLGFTTQFYAPATKIYYLGFAGDDRLNIKIDGLNIISNTYNNTDYWSIFPVYLSEGNHQIEVEGINLSNEYNNWVGNPGSMAVEIYNNNYTQIKAAINASSLNTIFSTGNLLSDQTNFQTFRTINGVKTWRFTYESYFNPFVQGMKGNWRPYAQNVYQENRVYDNILTPGKNGINVSNSGYLSSFMSYWILQSSGDWGVNPSTAWVNTNIIKQYDKYGQEAENQDALKRYSAASFDFAGQLPSAVASNAMRREIFSNSFEDVSRINIIPDTSATKEFTLTNGQPMVANIYDNTVRVSSEAHSGNYSVKLPSAGIQLSTRKHFTEQKDPGKPYLTKTNKNEFLLKSTEGLYPRGFEPKPDNKYLISFWIKDKQPLNRNINVLVNVGNANNPSSVTLNCKAIVEGWKQMEGVFSIPSSGDNKRFDISIRPINSVDAYIDDIRIHPNDAHMKTYVYDDKSYRLMAELDENAFATFYEYDDEGSLIRVKKETERGIATIKENHSSYRRRPSPNP